MNTAKCVAFLLLVACVVQATGLKAQTCAAPLPLLNPHDAPVASGNTCGGVDSVQEFCGGQLSVGKPDDVYQLNIGTSGRTFTQLSVAGDSGGSSSFHPTVYIYSGACATGEGCRVMADEGSSPVDTPPDVLPAGQYFLVVTASASDPSGACGPYTIQVNGVLPVQLQRFSVE